ncbi:MAG TPA: lamin tail domain-containing protein, partial [Candidatus Paceibacterota bacterium]
ELRRSRIRKKSFWVTAAIFMAVTMLGGYFILNISARGELEASLNNTMRGLTSLFVATDDSQKEIISFQDKNASKNDSVNRSPNVEAGSFTEDILSVAPSVKTTAQNKTQNNAKNIDSAKLPPSFPVVATQTPSHLPSLFISELVAGTKNSATDEFIEIYNPTDQVIDLSGFYIKRKATPSSTAGNLISKSSSVFNRKSIAPHGFFLIASKAYSGNIVADVFYSQNTTFLADNGDMVTLYDKDDNVIDEISYTALPRGKSWERKANVSNSCVSPQGAGELLGNGCDTGSTSDFVLREVPTPQNNGSWPEPKSPT